MSFILELVFSPWQRLYLKENNFMAAMLQILHGTILYTIPHWSTENWFIDKGDTYIISGLPVYYIIDVKWPQRVIS